MSRILRKFESVNPWHLMWLTVILTEIFTAVLNAIQSHFRWGFISYELITIGAIDALFVPAVVAPIIIIFVMQIAKLRADMGLQQEFTNALRESEKRYKDLAELLPQAVYELDDAGRIIFANRHGLAMFGYTQEDVDRGLDVTKVVIAEDIDRLLKDVQKLLDGEQIGSLEYTALRKDGSTFPILTFDTPILRDNKIVGLRGIGIDITERKRAEAAIEASEKKLKALFDTVNDAIMVVDPQGRILDVNNVTCERLGYRRDELLKMTPRDFDTPEYAAKVGDRLAEISRRGSAIFETAWVTRDGGIIPIEISARAIEYDGKPAFLSVARDLTERKRMEDELAEAGLFTEQIIRSAGEGIIVYGRDLRYQVWNPYMERLTGLSAERLWGKILSRSFPSSWRQA